jgi:uncharacterized tellurite resistance protein B-like protein
MNTPQKLIDNSELPLTNVEIRLIQAKLLAIMSRIDGRILEVENLVAESMLELMDQKEVFKLKTLYLEELEKPQKEEDIDEIVEFMNRAPVQERISLLKMLSSLAICDGEIHENEEQFLKNTMRRLKVIVQIGNPADKRR